MTLNEQFIFNTATTLNLPEEVVSKVIRYQWDGVKEATRTGSTIEISGMGRLQVRPAKLEQNRQMFTNYYNAAKRKLDALEKDAEGWYGAYKTVKGLEKDLEFLNMKDTKNIKGKSNGQIDGLQKDSGGNI